MAGIDEVLERLVTDAAFRDQLRHDPASALSGYVLFDEDLDVLAATLDDAEGGEHGVEQRTSKSTLFAALTEAGDMFAGGAGEQPDVATPDEEATSAPRSQSRNNLKQLGIALHEEDAIDDLATAPGVEAAAQITYPGVYVQEIPSPESDAADASEIGMPPAVEEAETVHAYVSAKGADMEGDSSQPPDPDDAFEDGDSEAIEFLTYEFEKGAGGSGEGAQGPSEMADLPGDEADSPSTREGFEGQVKLTSFSMGGHNPSAEVEGNEVAVEPVETDATPTDPSMASTRDEPLLPEGESPASPGNLAVPEPGQEDKDHKGWSDVVSFSHSIQKGSGADETFEDLSVDPPAPSDAMPFEDAAVDPPSANSSYQDRVANEAFLAQPDADAASAATNDPEFKYAPVRRSTQSATEGLQAPDAATSADGNDPAIEEIVIVNEGFERASPEDAFEGTGEGPRDAGGE